MNDKTKTIFATLEEPVTLASSSAAMLATKEAGRVVGFGCNGAIDAGVVIATGEAAKAEAPKARS